MYSHSGFSSKNIEKRNSFTRKVNDKVVQLTLKITRSFAKIKV